MKKSHATGWPLDAPTAAQLGEFFLQIKARRITGKRLQLLLRGGSHFKDRIRIQEILGDDVIFPDEVALTCNLAYPDEVINGFVRTMPDTKTLEWLKKKGFGLVPGPPQSFNPCRIVEVLPNIIHQRDITLLDSEYGTSMDSEVHTQWYAMKKVGVRRQPKYECIPSVSAWIWFVGIFLHVRGQRLFEEISARFSFSVIVGCNKSSGLTVSTSVGMEYSVPWASCRNLS